MIKKLLSKIFKRKHVCKHTNKTEKYICYQDRYVKYICDDCGETIYEDIS